VGLSGREYRVYFYSTYQNQFNKIKANNEANNRINDKNHVNNTNGNTQKNQKNSINEKRKQINDADTSNSPRNQTETSVPEEQADSLKQEFKKKKLR
jgi:hypothetical protein